MHIKRITIETKKNTTVDTQWLVWQERPYPTITGGGWLRWQGAEGLLPEYGRPATGLPGSYKACLLRLDFAPENAKGNRIDYAGYNENHDSQPNPSIVYRGREMGEVEAQIKIDKCYIGGYSVWFKGGYGNALTAGERDLLKVQVAQHLMDYVTDHADELKAEAIESIRKGVTGHIARLRTDLQIMEAEMQQALKDCEQTKEN